MQSNNKTFRIWESLYECMQRNIANLQYVFTEWICKERKRAQKLLNKSLWKNHDALKKIVRKWEFEKRNSRS